MGSDCNFMDFDDLTPEIPCVDLEAPLADPSLQKVGRGNRTNLP